MSGSPEGPARLLAGHIQDRGLSIVAGAKLGWRNVGQSAFSAYAARGLLSDGRYTLADRVSVGNEYTGLYGRLARSGQDSTQRLVSSGGNGSHLTEAQALATIQLVSINSHLSRNDREILHHVLVRDCWPKDAIIAVLGKDWAKSVAPRFREALDALIEAFTAARRRKFRMNEDA
jgi:hypothetical protein